MREVLVTAPCHPPAEGENKTLAAVSHMVVLARVLQETFPAISLIVACVSVVAETCLPSRCLATNHVIISEYYYHAHTHASPVISSVQMLHQTLVWRPLQDSLTSPFWISSSHKCLVKSTNNEDPNYSFVSILLLLHLSLCCEYSSQAPSVCNLFHLSFWNSKGIYQTPWHGRVAVPLCFWDVRLLDIGTKEIVALVLERYPVWLSFVLPTIFTHSTLFPLFFSFCRYSTFKAYSPFMTIFHFLSTLLWNSMSWTRLRISQHSNTGHSVEGFRRFPQLSRQVSG